jgi:hypothetical protein
MTSSPWLPEEDDRSQVDEQSSSSPHPGLYRVADAEVSLNTKQSIKANVGQLIHEKNQKQKNFVILSL